jgi:hypothetical protein
MFKTVIIAALTLFIIPSLYSQSFDKRLDSLIGKYKSFDYPGVIKEAEILIADSTIISSVDLYEIYRTKAIAHYSLSDMPNALNSFIAILKINPEYQLDQMENSPKIIAYFEEIRNNFFEINNQSDQEMPVVNTGKIEKSDLPNSTTMGTKMPQIYSLFIPGLGHIATKPSTKGWALFGSGVITLGLSVYYIVDVNHKEEAYLQATNKIEIEQKYNRYNSAYKRRNLTVAAFAAIWIYSQIDFLYFSGNDIKQESTFSFHINFTSSDGPLLNMKVHL